VSQQDPPEADQPVMPKPKKVKDPPEIQFAGFAWLFVAAVQVFGVVMLFVNLDTFVPRPTQAAPGSQQFNARSGPPTPPSPSPAPTEKIQAVLYVAIGVALLIGVVFAVTGLQALCGGAKSFMGAGIASIFLGLLAGASGVAQASQSVNPIAFVASGLSALGALMGGVAAISGSKKYQMWRKQRKARAIDREAAYRRPPVPVPARAAGWLWLFAAVTLLGSIAFSILAVGEVYVTVRPAAANESYDWNVSGLMVLLGAMGLAGTTAVIWSIAGVRATSGVARGFTVSGIGSIVAGLLFAVVAVLVWLHPLPRMLAILWGVAGMAVVAGGWFGLIGRAAYAHWRQTVRQLNRPNPEEDYVPLDIPRFPTGGSPLAP
jgi:hypothetical protein